MTWFIPSDHLETYEKQNLSFDPDVRGFKKYVLYTCLKDLKDDYDWFQLQALVATFSYFFVKMVLKISFLAITK